MPALTRLLLIPAVLSFFCAGATAKDIKGAPKELIQTPGTKASYGAFGKDAAECRSFHRKGGEKIVLIGRYEGLDSYTDCGERFCNNTVLSHRRIPSGFLLTLRYNGLTETRNWTLRITRIRGGSYTFIDHGQPSRWKRCARQDIVTGIGRPVQTNSNEANENYSAFYARAVPNLCPSLEINTEPDSSFLSSRDVDAMVQAARDAEWDHDALPGFCREVLGAFGANGRIVSGLLRARKKSD